MVLIMQEKTCLVKCIRGVKNALLNEEMRIMPNIFQDSAICELGISFLVEGREFPMIFGMTRRRKNIPMKSLWRYQKINMAMKKRLYGC